MGKRGYTILPEAAREVAKSDPRFIGKSIKEITMLGFQRANLKFQEKQIKKVPKDKIVFSDRGFGDPLTYLRVNNLDIADEEWKYFKNIRYAGIFILDFFGVYKKDKLRQETEEEQKEIQRELIKMYKELGYKVIIVPFMSVEERVDFILERINREIYFKT